MPASKAMPERRANGNQGINRMIHRTMTNGRSQTRKPSACSFMEGSGGFILFVSFKLTIGDASLHRHVYPTMNCTAPLIPGLSVPIDAFDR